jgi:hypothetical protein
MLGIKELRTAESRGMICIWYTAKRRVVFGTKEVRKEKSRGVIVLGYVQSVVLLLNECVSTPIPWSQCVQSICVLCCRALFLRESQVGAMGACCPEQFASCVDTVTRYPWPLYCAVTRELCNVGLQGLKSHLTEFTSDACSEHLEVGVLPSERVMKLGVER